MTHERIEFNDMTVGIFIDFKRNMTQQEIDRLEEIIDGIEAEFEEADAKLGVPADLEDFH